MNWNGDAKCESGVVTREFIVQVDDRCVPAVLWTPENSKTGHRHPLVLIGHGGSQHKTHPGIVDLAGRFVRKHGFVAAAIDGPIQGARRSDGLTGLEVQAEFSAMWAKDPGIDAMVADWQATIDAVQVLDEVDPDVVGWYGVSMGTAYGLPLAAMDSRIKVALLGMWGTNFVNSERLAHDAAKLNCPVLFQQKWDDGFFTRKGQIDLFDRLASAEKWLKVYPGGHTPVSGEQLDDVEHFLASRLKEIALDMNKAVAAP